MAETSNEPRIYRGLKDVYFERSETTFIDGKAGELRYRGYSIHDLAQNSCFEETAYLLVHGELPTAAQLGAFDVELKAARVLPAEILDVIRLVRGAHPMDVLRTAVSALAAFDPETADTSRAATIRKGVRLSSQVPMIVAAHERIRNGLDPLAPDPALGHAANFLWLLKGAKPSVDAAKLLDTDLVLHAEHGSNASSFTARVVVGTDANIHAAVTAAIAALSGPAHGGAAEDVMRMAEEIGDPSNTPAFVKAKRAAKEPITGFGHRVYRAEDPRARHMREGVKRLSKEMGEPKWYEILEVARRRDEAVCPPRRECECRFLLGRHLLLAQDPEGSVRADLRRGPRSGVDRAGAGAARQQHSDPAANALQWAGAARLRADRRSTLIAVADAANDQVPNA